MIASAIYLAATGQFSAEYFFAVGAAIFTLDQAIYAVIKATPLGDLLSGLADKIKAAIKNKIGKNTEEALTTTEPSENGTESPQNGRHRAHGRRQRTNTQ